ncbi:hypothetical protein J2S17_005771 [Cytobacillus purgationiresistens]|uniref:Uncharacterized protein n=1 Tax=Cytobacillus purgationiresistens TaxID=863449 RepID=A0ABU0ARC8_9BACI|nr:hypothetical protein [Cytobacillus purgationiresistens]
MIVSVSREGSKGEIFLAQNKILPPFELYWGRKVSDTVNATLPHQSHK